MARTKQTAVRKPKAGKGKGKKEGMPPLPSQRSSPRRRTAAAAAAPKTPPKRGSNALALATRSSPRFSSTKPTRTTKAKLPKLPTKKALAQSKALAAVLDRQHKKNFPGLTTPPSNSSKGVHFSVVDDECLCKAFCHVSEDSAKGANQTHSDFWIAVGEQANSLLKECGRPERSVESLDTRWTKKISKSTLAFKRYHKEALNVPQSGWNAGMYEEYAKELYKADEGKEYGFLHCSLILKAMPKYDWDAETVDSTAEGTTATGGPMGGGFTRPKGNRATKGVAKEARAKNRSRKTQDSMSLDGTAAMEQLLANSSAMTEHFNNLALRNALYLEFQMLMRMNRVEEANEIYNKMSNLSKPDLIVDGIPQRVSAGLDMESSDESSLELVARRGKPKDDTKYATTSESSVSGSSSGGDAAGARAAAIKAALKGRDLEQV
jgi:hypothetical protein